MTRNVAASVRQRLLNKAQAEGRCPHGSEFSKLPARLWTKADTFDQPLTDLAAAFVSHAVIYLQVIEFETKGFAVVEQADDFGVANQRFGGNAAPIQTDAAHMLFFNHGVCPNWPALMAAT
jgi:hypothetical protein